MKRFPSNYIRDLGEWLGLTYDKRYEIIMEMNILIRLLNEGEPMDNYTKFITELKRSELIDPLRRDIYDIKRTLYTMYLAYSIFQIRFVTYIPCYIYNSTPYRGNHHPLMLLGIVDCRMDQMLEKYNLSNLNYRMIEWMPDMSCLIVASYRQNVSKDPLLNITTYDADKYIEDAINVFPKELTTCVYPYEDRVYSIRNEAQIIELIKRNYCNVKKFLLEEYN